MDATQLTIAGILMSGLVSLAGVVKHLYAKMEADRVEQNRRHSADMADVKTRLNECENEREKLWQNYRGLMQFIAKQLKMEPKEIKQQVLNESENLEQ